MVVGEPTLMGGEFGDEDERVITRLENNQYETNGSDDPAVGMSGAPNPGGAQPDIKPPVMNPGATTPSQAGGATTPGGSQPAQFHGSPLNSPWAADKKTPQPIDGVPSIESKTE